MMNNSTPYSDETENKPEDTEISQDLDYSKDHGGSGALPFLQFIHDRVPLIAQLCKEKLISLDNPFNCVYARRSIETQTQIYDSSSHHKNFPSRAVKFAIAPISAGVQSKSPDPSLNYHCFHGNISGRDIRTMINKGLGGYAHLRAEGLVTPSWRAASECYGYYYHAPDGSIFTLFFGGVCSGPSRCRANTFDVGFNADGSIRVPGTHTRDAVILDDELEWIVDTRKVQLCGLIVKHYTSCSSLMRLNITDKHGHRKRHQRSVDLIPTIDDPCR